MRLRWSRGSVLAFGTQVRGFKPDRSRRIFQSEKILSTPSFGEEVKPSLPCRRFTAYKRSLNVTWKSGIFRQNSWAISRPCSSTFGCQDPLKTTSGESWNIRKKKVHKHLHLWPLGSHRKRLAVRSGTSKGSTISQYGCSTFGALTTEAQQKEETFYFIVNIVAEFANRLWLQSLIFCSAWCSAVFRKL